jgi:hypothetical protein
MHDFNGLSSLSGLRGLVSGWQIRTGQCLVFGPASVGTGVEFPFLTMWDIIRNRKKLNQFEIKHKRISKLN